MNSSKFFYEKSTILVAIIATLATFGYLFFVMIDAAACYEITDESVKSLGTSFGYSMQMVQDFFSARTNEMIDCYQSVNLIWDNIFPVLYGIMNITWLSVIFKPFSNTYKFINLLPIAQVIFDWLENINLYSLGNAYLNGDSLSQTQVSMGSFFTIIKWSIYILTFLFIFIGIVLRVRKALWKRKDY